jgi:hypothetical protein
MVKKVWVDPCDVEIWAPAAVLVVVIHLTMVVEAAVVEVEVEETEVVHHGLHGIKLNMDPVIY